MSQYRNKEQEAQTRRRSKQVWFYFYNLLITLLATSYDTDRIVLVRSTSIVYEIRNNEAQNCTSE